MTKVEHTKTHPTDKATIGGIVGWTLVADAELVLVGLPFGEADGNILCQCIKEMSDVKVGEIQLQHKLLTSLDYWKPVKPILISRTEKITTNVGKTMGDWCYNSLYKKVFQMNGDITDYDFKILALPEHFSPQQLQDIVDGKLKEGKCLVECENKYIEPPDTIHCNRGYDVTQIKLNPHITIYSVEETKTFSMQDMIDYGKKLLELEKSKTPVEEKMYTREEVKAIALRAWNPNGDEQDFDKWFETNVK